MKNPDHPEEEKFDPEAYERQLRAALFDAENGGTSFVSDDMPLELLEQFQAQVLAFEARSREGSKVTVASLLGDAYVAHPGELVENLSDRMRLNNVSVDKSRG